MNEWQEFRVGTPSTTPNWIEPHCQPFSEVSHVTHISSALNIIRQRTIQPQLVYDESILNTRRILVTWASPNYWTPGYRYGNVSFDLDWNRMIEGKRFYWVEVMDYRPKACRILISNLEYGEDTGLQVYDPTAGDGPWWWNRLENIHYRNGRICLEIMLETELPIGTWGKISFVKHHEQYCCVDASTCPDLGLLPQRAGARFLAGVVSQNLEIAGLAFDDWSVRGGWSFLLMNLPQNGYLGDVTRTDASSNALARSVAFSYYQNRVDEFLVLARLFFNRDELEASLTLLTLAKFPNAAPEELI